MPQIVDQFGNPFRGFLDHVGGDVVTETGRSYTAVLGSLNAETVIDLNGHSVTLFDIRTAAGALTLVFEGSVNGVDYFALPAFTHSGLIAAAINAEGYVPSIVIATTATGLYVIGVSGLRKVRCRVSAYTSGNVTVGARASIADYIIYSKQIPSLLAVQIDGSANASTTITLPAAGVGMFHYITSLSWHRHCTAALVGTGAFNITSTNMPGSIKWRVGNAIAVGEHKRDVELTPATPLKSLLANTATTFVAAAAGAAVLTTGLCTYYIGA